MQRVSRMNNTSPRRSSVGTAWRCGLSTLVPSGCAQGRLDLMQTTPVQQQEARQQWWRWPGLQPLRHREFRSFWISYGLTVSGFQVQRVGLAVLAYQVTGSSFLLALVFTGDSIPMLLLSTVGGMAADRLSKQWVLVGASAVLAVLAGGMAALIGWGVVTVGWLLLFAALTGICYAFTVPSRQAMVRDLVPAEDFVPALALTAMLRQGGRLAGPAIGSVALLLAGPFATFAWMAVAQVVLVLMVSRIRLPFAMPPPPVRVAAPLSDAVLYVCRQPVVAPLLLVTVCSSLSAMAYAALSPVFAQGVFGKSGDAVGIMLLVGGAGSLIGSLAVAAQPDRVTRAPVAYAATAVFGLAVAAFALSPSYPAALTLLCIAGAAVAVSSVVIVALAQQHAPHAMQGRVAGIYQVTWELQAAGAIITGALADRIGPRPALAGAGFLCVLLTLVIAATRPYQRAAELDA